MKEAHGQYAPCIMYIDKSLWATEEACVTTIPSEYKLIMYSLYKRLCLNKIGDVYLFTN